MAIEQGDSRLHINIDHRYPPGVANALSEAEIELNELKAKKRTKLSIPAYRNLRDHKDDNAYVASLWAEYTESKGNPQASSTIIAPVAEISPSKEREHLPTIELRIKSKAESHINEPGQRPTTRYKVDIRGTEVSLSHTEMQIITEVAKSPGIDKNALWKNVLGDDHSITDERKRAIKNRVVEKTTIDGVPLIVYKKGNKQRPSKWEVPNFNIAIVDETATDHQPIPVKETSGLIARAKTIFRHTPRPKTA